MAKRDWTSTTFEDLINERALEIGDGYRAKNEELGGDGPIFLRAGHVKDTHIDFDGVERFHLSLVDRVRSKLSQAGDAVVTTKGNSTGRTAFVSKLAPQFVYSPHLSYWRSVDARRVKSEFLRYWSRSNEFSVQLAGMKASTDMAPYLSLADQKRLRITLPPPEEQGAIGHILGALDDKIELNRRMNETLEAMIRALFKSWFVDFDPVLAKLEGRRLDSPPSTAELFPDAFDESEFGSIPRGWSSGSIGDVAEHRRRGIQPREIDDATPYIALDNMPKRCISISEWGTAEGLESGKFEFKKGEILFGKLRPYFHKVGIAPVDGVCSTDIVVVVPRSEAWFGFVLGHVSSDAFVEHTNAGSIGTKMPRTSWGEMARFPVVIPPENVADAFTTQIGFQIERLLGSIHENRTLATLRDTLLPKLISGELRVKAAEKIVEAVA